MIEIAHKSPPQSQASAAPQMKARGTTPQML
jgi:hypothetical protein